MKKRKHVYLPCEDECCTLEFFVGDFDEDFYSFQFLNSANFCGSLLDRIVAAIRLIFKKNTVWSEIVILDRKKAIDFLHRCEAAITEDDAPDERV